MVLEAGQDDNAQASEVIAAQLDGEPLRTAFNPRYLEAGLAALSTDYVRFSFTDAAKPAVISGQKEIDGDVDKNFRYLIMPIRFGL